LCGCESWAVRELGKYRVTSAETKCLRNTAKYTWKDYKTSEDILSELKINLVVKAIQNYMKGHNMFGGWTEADRQTDCHA
jgi:hypothetical protein